MDPLHSLSQKNVVVVSFFWSRFLNFFFRFVNCCKYYGLLLCYNGWFYILIWLRLLQLGRKIKHLLVVFALLVSSLWYIFLGGTTVHHIFFQYNNFKIYFGPNVNITVSFNMWEGSLPDRPRRWRRLPGVFVSAFGSSPNHVPWQFSFNKFWFHIIYGWL